MNGDGLDFVSLHGTTIIERIQKIDQIVSEKRVIDFKPKSRKCLFASESRSKYFDVNIHRLVHQIKIILAFQLQVYTENLCKIDCRIKRALMICGCVPFFYAIPTEKVCDINGMICLTANNNSWCNVTTCECPSLCETTIMTKMTNKEVISRL